MFLFLTFFTCLNASAACNYELSMNDGSFDIAFNNFNVTSIYPDIEYEVQCAVSVPTPANYKAVISDIAVAGSVFIDTGYAALTLNETAYLYANTTGYMAESDDTLISECGAPLEIFVMLDVEHLGDMPTFMNVYSGSATLNYIAC
jgi:hypothetical protein